VEDPVGVSLTRCIADDAFKGVQSQEVSWEQESFSLKLGRAVGGTEAVTAPTTWRFSEECISAHCILYF
jgi:hypothetical protein